MIYLYICKIKQVFRDAPVLNEPTVVCQHH